MEETYQAIAAMIRFGLFAVGVACGILIGYAAHWIQARKLDGP